MLLTHGLNIADIVCMLLMHGLFTVGLHVVNSWSVDTWSVYALCLWHMVCMLLIHDPHYCCNILCMWLTHGLLTHGLLTHGLLTHGLFMCCLCLWHIV